MDRKGSKVLKVALSAALAAAFTPMAAAPAFAAAPTAQEVTTSISSALGYTYDDSYQYTGTLFVDGSTILAGYTAEQVGTQSKAVMNDMARFLGALKRYNNSPIVAIKYGNTKYVWSESGTLKGSNWVKDGDSKNTTLVSEVVAALGPNLLKNNTNSVQLGISTDGTSYSNITLKACISTAKLAHDGKVSETNYSLKSALEAAQSGDTVTMTSDAITNEQLTLPAGVTLEGNGRTLMHLSNPANTEAGSSAAILHYPSASGDAAVIRNLKIDGPNSKPATTATDGTVTRDWTEGEYAIKSYGEHANLTVQNVEITRAQSAMMATQGGKLTVKGTLRMSGLEYGGIEVSENASSKLILDSTASITYTETADTPFAWIDKYGSIENKTKLDLAKVIVPTNNNHHKAHYYLNSADSKGAHLYTDTALNEAGTPASEVALGGKHEYALLKFVPSVSGTYCFASTGSVDAAAELYNVTSTGALGSKVASGDNEQGENFRVFAKLTGGSTYVLRVGISASAATAASAGTISLTVSQANAESLDSYVVSLPANTYYYDDENLTTTSTKLNTTVRSAIDGRILSVNDYDKAILKVAANGNTETATITEPGRYILKVTPKSGNAKLSGEAICYFDVKDADKIADYNFKYNNTLVFASNQVASITALAPKGYRYGNSIATFTESNLKVVGWYSVKGDAKTLLATAPSAVGDYVLTLSPVNTTSNNQTTTFDTTSTIDLPFSITKGKVSVPSVRSGLTYTGSAQVGVSTGANYTLSGTYSATNAGTYSCTATLAEGYSWSDGTTAPKTFTWSIAKARIAVPTGNANLTYTGKAQTGISAGTGYTVSGTTSATEPGDYTATVTPTANYTWTDGTTGSKQVKWTIAKAAAGITATPSSVVVSAGGKATVTLKQAGTAAYTVASSDGNVATASVAGSSVTISAKAAGTATVTVSTAATARYAAGSTTIAVSVPKAEGASGSATTIVVAPDGTTTKVTNKFKVTTEADPSDTDVVPAVSFTGTSVKSGKVTVPTSVTLADGITYKVTSIAAKAFKGKKVTGVVIPKSVTRIGKDAFAGCKKLKTISFHNKVKSIGANVLKGSAAKTATLKSSKLSKTSIKNLVKGSKLTTVKCSGLSKKTKAKYVKWAKSYKKNVRFK